MSADFDNYGPDYDIDSAALRKKRSRARKGLKELSREAIVEYANDVEKAVLAKQRSFLKKHGEPQPRVNCASGTNHTTGEAIHKAVQAQQLAALHAAPAQIRRARTDVEWRQLYEEAMREKRERKTKKEKAA